MGMGIDQPTSRCVFSQRHKQGSQHDCRGCDTVVRTRHSLATKQECVPGSRGGIPEFYNSVGTTILHSIDGGLAPLLPLFSVWVLGFVAVALLPES
jgi:hypothetical protein